MRRLTQTALISVSLLAAVGSVRAANLIQDGTFDMPSAGATFQEYTGGSSFGPWAVGGASVDLIGGYWQDPAGTAGSVDLNGSAPGSISQAFDTTAGKSYNVSFYLAGNPDSGQSPDPATKTGTVMAGANSNDFMFTNTGAQTKTDMGYQLEHFTFLANGPTTTLSFAGTNAGPYGAVIGDVNVSAVPEPATWALMLMGVGDIGLMLRRGRRTSSDQSSEAYAA